MKKNILLLETIAEEANQLLIEAEDIEVYTAFAGLPPAEVLSKIDAVITRGLGQVNQQLLDACPNLQVAARCGVGLDNVAVNEASLRKVKVVNAPGSNASTVAEHAIALMLMLQRNLYQALNDVKSGNWAARSTFKSDEVGEKTLGILGLGNIGLKVAKIAEALGMNVIYWAKSPKDVPYQHVSKEELLATADIISIHLPLNAETENLINTEALALVKPSCLIINTARGQIVNKAALVDALNTGRLAGYGADVPTSPPPAADDALIAHPKALITAHVSSLTATTYKNMCVSTVNNVLAILRGQAPQPGCIFNLKDL
ncbi:NAD(P)-dependent oxidoreductase [Haliscomenobacter hydrossis]|uniref:Phosphoglycerate dehydrogenase n=1 Tax=Haliscomenobacter hydrossis (strain ATCC 27775 / DSM 1100 / LMG 10767 / O) TaxID=760192 RepID=F4KT17_HALH1|nr:NAD(P)-dependent oxidoreductase [Haliscomenobacter hydrossis]AEE50087.1 Phosphoglycerate dehydrogenase [Haliscomenobacter hydrossis DSM 1100]